MPEANMKPQEFVQRIEDSTLPEAVLVELLRAVLERGQPFWFEAPGFSMSPFIQDGDVITVAPLSGASPGHGDVVAFLRPDSGKLVVHRVVGKREDTFLIRGDNADKADDLAPAASILGRVTEVKRRDGKRVRLGLGPERYLIALLSRWGLFRPLLLWIWPLVRPIVRRLWS
jgi:SOS-response transcriptional repressor LexA